MHRRFLQGYGAVVLTVCLASVAGAGGAPSSRSVLKPILLHPGSFDPVRESPARAAAGQPEALRSLPSRDDLFLVQFSGPPLSSWLESLRDHGADTFGYVPQHTYLARVPMQARDPIRALPFVRAVSPYLPAFRVEPGLAARAARGQNFRSEAVRLLVQAAPDRSPASIWEAIAAEMPRATRTEMGRHPGASLVALDVPAADLASLLPALAGLRDVRWIEEQLPSRTNNFHMRGVLQSGVASSNPIFNRGLIGSGQIIAQSDSGLDVGHCFFQDPLESVVFELVDPDNPPAVPATNPDHRKILAYQYHSNSNTLDEVGHGTHVGGTAVGDDLAHPASGTDPGIDTYDGMAPGAKLVFQDIDKRGGFLETPVNLYGFFKAAYNAGARIHTNSWGAQTNSYTSSASQVDRFMWDHPDILVLYSAGNNGPGEGTVGSPGSAKNLITVGMTQSPAGGDANNLSSGSSNGPTSDGRRKPEVVNVGTPVGSASADTTCGILFIGGTSMATPGVAGGAALVRQYVMEGYYPHGYAGSGPAVTPSAALLKAIVLNSTVNISGTNVDAPIPDNSQGWGRVLLENALFFPSDAQRLMILRDDDLTSSTDGFAVGATAAESFSLFNCRLDVPLRVTLVWSDPPVEPTSGQAWVNDLNLEVETPGGEIFLGNDFADGVSTTGGTADDRNNVEQVLIPAGAVAGGTYTVRVIPAEVAVGPQPYALVVTGDVSLSPRPDLVVTSSTRAGSCDADSFLDNGEKLTIDYTIENAGCGASGPALAQLNTGSSLPISVSPGFIDLAPLAAGASTTASFEVSLGDAPEVCGEEVPLLLRLDAQDGVRWEQADRVLLGLDPATGSRTEVDDVESGDQSAGADPDWGINSCLVSSGTSSWHMGDSDCSGIPRDASSHSLLYSLSLAAGENLAQASFLHAFQGYANSSLMDRAIFEIDHDLDGNFDAISSWATSSTPGAMSLAGPFDLSAFNQGRGTSVLFRFRFQSAAQWVGGPNNAAGWDVDDFQVDVSIDAQCDLSIGPPPGDVGNTLTAQTSGADALLSWGVVGDAVSYRIERSESPDLSDPEAFSALDPAFTDAGALQDPRTFYYKVFAAGCGDISAD